MARFVDRRTFLEAQRGHGPRHHGRPAPRVVARGRGRRPAGRGGRAVGHRDAVRLAHQPGREAACGTRRTIRSSSAIPRPSTYRPGLATEWKPSNEMRTWTFKLRSGVQFHEGWGEMTAEDVKFTVEQNFKPDAQGGSAPLLPHNLDRIEMPDKLTVVMHFKIRAVDVPSLFSQYVGYQNITSKKYLESVGEEKASTHPIGTGPYRHVEGKQGDFHRFEAVPNHWRKTPDFKELVIRRIPDPATRTGGPARGRDRHRAGVRRLPRPGARRRACASTRRRTPRSLLGDPHGPDDAGPRGLLPDLSVGRRSEGSARAARTRGRCGWP